MKLMAEISCKEGHFVIVKGRDDDNKTNAPNYCPQNT